MEKMILCECGKFVEHQTFKDYIPTSSGPSTPTFGHVLCGLIFDFVDIGLPKSYSSKIALKSLALKYAKKNDMSDEAIGQFLLEVDRLKSQGNLSDMEILIKASKFTIDRETPRY